MRENCREDYADIFCMTYPLSDHDNIRHPRMPVSDRAKIFAPFAALKGYEDELERELEKKSNSS